MDLCNSLVKWLQTFTVENPSSSMEDLMDGVTMGQVLNQISPQFFTSAWLSKIKAGTSTDWRIKVSNLKKIHKGITDFYAVKLGQQLNETHMPDLHALVEHNDRRELSRLLQLVLGCAVNCDDKHEYIRRIMDMEESVQHDVMRAIQELMTEESRIVSRDVPVVESDNQVKKLTEELQKMSEEKDGYAQRCHDLDIQIILLQEAKSNLLAEIDRLNDRLNQGESFDDPSSLAGRRYLQMQQQVEQLQEELYRSESARDDFRIKAESFQRELLELQQKNDELESMLVETNQLKDEVDILRHTAEKVPKYEASIASYKRKLEEMSTVRGELKLIEEKNVSLIQKNFDLEEEVKKAGLLKTQLDAYKRQVQDLQLKCTDETKRADKAEFESKRLQEKVQVLTQDKKCLTEERNSLKEMLEESKCSQQLNMLHSGSDISNPSTPGQIELMSVPPDIRERILRLQHENQMLKMQSPGEDSSLLRSMLDDANVHKHELECQVRSLNQRILELEANVGDLTELQQKMTSDGDAAGSEIRKRLTEQMERCRKSETELLKSQQQVEDLETKLQASVDKVGKLETVLSKKETELKEMEEKYKKYLEKARNLIKQLDPKNNPTVTAPPFEVSTLRSQLAEKDKMISLLEQENERIKSVRETEEKLMTTAWYNLGAQIHRKTADDRLATSGLPSTAQHQSSFLNRQRQAHVKPNQIPGVTRQSPSVNVANVASR